MIETPRRYWPVLLFLGALVAAPPPMAAAPPYTIGYLAIEDDPRHKERRSYANIVIRPAIQPFEGAKAGLRAGRIIGRSLEVEFRLTRVEGRSAGDLAAGLERLYVEAGARFFLVDAPGPVIAELARATRGRGVLLLNVSALDDALRGQDCQSHLMHLVPSRAMLNDALAQDAAPAASWCSTGRSPPTKSWPRPSSARPSAPACASSTCAGSCRPTIPDSASGTT
ncbi:MAG: hypothetical protein O7F14_13070 [Alphaproteobacteria bacterium]|nr:hypothetical protein [Alphaproteobacteria bacterium]